MKISFIPVGTAKTLHSRLASSFTARLMQFFSSPKFLPVYSGVVTATLAATVLMGATQTVAKKTRFEEIEVQRINLVEPDGTLRLVISDTARAPGAIFKGREYPHPGGRRMAGMIFFNDEGTENGGLIFGGAKDKSGKLTSSGHLSFDNYEQDQVMVLESNQDGDKKTSYVGINEQPDWSLAELIELLDKNKDLPPAQQQALAERFAREKGGAGMQRAMLGRLSDGSVALKLRDRDGRVRILLSVAADGNPSLQFLDAEGKAVNQLPAQR